MPIANFTLPGASAPSFPEAVTEMVMLASHRIQMRRDRRRTLCHIRQIAMYVCHVALQIPLYEIAAAFGRDRTTVGHACHVVEDRRDDPAFDEFVAVVERTVTSVFRSNGVLGNE
ncbi:helix-turn-helix domain-containing protein|nr:helix-turn-helix domain-containing protein [Rhizobium altiplani]